MQTQWLKCCALSLTVAAAAALPAHAGTVSEVESNDTYATAQLVASAAAAQTVVNGERSFADPSDDFFRFFVSAFTTLRIASTSPDASADSILGLYGPTGSLLASNDDAGFGSLMSGLTFVTGNLGGLFTIGFSGYNAGLLACTGGVTSCYDTNNDFVFDTFVAGGGAGGSTGWLYSLTIDQAAAIPEPPLLALFGIGLAFVAIERRRRNRREIASIR
ncbi:MAG: PEP-CTERM sorting domain-containing protein [Burkholderiaceae bacterium]